MREESEESGGEKRGLDVPIRPDLIPIGCPNLSRLRASIGKSGTGTDGGDRGRETRGRIGGREREETGGVSAGRRNGGEYPIDRDEGEENSRRNERANGARASFAYVSFVSFRFPRRERDLIGEKKMSPFLAFRRLCASHHLGNPKGTEGKKRKIVCHVPSSAGSKRGIASHRGWKSIKERRRNVPGP